MRMMETIRSLPPLVIEIRAAHRPAVRFQPGRYVPMAAPHICTTDFFKGNLNNWKDVGESALRGGITNGIGYWVSKGMAALKVKQIENMPRADKKVYLRDNVYHSSQANVNINMQSFIKSSMSKKNNIVEARLPIFRSGFYSTVTSTLVALF